MWELPLAVEQWIDGLVFPVTMTVLGSGLVISLIGIYKTWPR